MSAWVELVSQPVALVAWGLLAFAWRAARTPAPGPGRRAALALAVFYFAVATPLGANLLVGALEGAASRAPAGCAAQPPGVIVVLAGGVSGRPASSADVGSLQLATFRRVLEALRLARGWPDVPVVLSGGSGERVREADLMASLATALGLPASRLVLERESRTTAEGAVNVARLLSARGQAAAPVHLVTSALHMPRAAAAFRRQGLEVCPAAVDRRLVRPAPEEALLPQITALEKSTAAFHEALGYLVYWATGRL